METVCLWSSSQFLSLLLLLFRDKIVDGKREWVGWIAMMTMRKWHSCVQINTLIRLNSGGNRFAVCFIQILYYSWRHLIWGLALIILRRPKIIFFIDTPDGVIKVKMARINSTLVIDFSAEWAQSNVYIKSWLGRTVSRLSVSRPSSYLRLKLWTSKSSELVSQLKRWGW